MTIFKGRYVKYFPIIAMAIGIMMFSIHPAEAKKNRYASIVMDAHTGMVISQRYADAPRYPASLTKMMTLYMTFEALRDGKFTKRQRLRVSSHAASQPPSKFGLKPGSSIRVEDAILALVTKSANDVAVVLAEALGGSEKNFAKLMTQRARQLGMRNTTFRNASGLPDKHQKSTARDMATLSLALIHDFPRDYRYFKTQRFSYAGNTYNNHNKLMKTYVGMDGIKTGYIYASGYNLAASAQRGGVRLVGIVFGGRTSKSRNAHMKEILDIGFSKVKSMRIARAMPPKPLPKPKSMIVASNTTQNGQVVRVATNSVTSTRIIKPAPFNAMALIDDTPIPPLSSAQGDTDDPADQKVVTPNLPSRVVSFSNKGGLTAREQVAAIHTPVRPSLQRATPPEKTTAPTTTASGKWAVQVGAFASHQASLIALKNTKNNIPKNIAQQSRYVIVPLMTNRGMIYRARLSGLSQTQAKSVCQSIRGNCLILSAP